MPFDVKAWLNEILKDATLEAAQRTVLETALGQDGVAKHLEASVSRQADYSRKMDEVRDREKKLQTHYESEYRRLAEWQTGAQAKFTEGQAALKKANERAEQLTAALTKVKADYQITDDLVPAAPQPAAHPAVDPAELDKRYLTQDAWNEEAKRVGTLFSFYPAELIDIVNKHREIFGSTLEIAPLVRKAQETGRPVVDVWRAEFNPEAKMAEKQAADRAIEIADAEKRGFEKGRAESARLPGAPPTGLPGSPLMAIDEFKPAAPDPNKAPELSGPQAAAAAFALHRYAPAGSPYAPTKQ